MDEEDVSRHIEGHSSNATKIPIDSCRSVAGSHVALRKLPYLCYLGKMTFVSDTARRLAVREERASLGEQARMRSRR